eukprot:5872-Eustigmatos_ZCMA.PRE.1
MSQALISAGVASRPTSCQGWDCARAVAIGRARPSARRKRFTGTISTPARSRLRRSPPPSTTGSRSGGRSSARRAPPAAG